MRDSGLELRLESKPGCVIDGAIASAVKLANEFGISVSFVHNEIDVHVKPGDSYRTVALTWHRHSMERSCPSP
jgi:hypothetical protein